MAPEAAVALVLALALAGCAGPTPSASPPPVSDSPTALFGSPLPDDGLVMADEYRGLANATAIDRAADLGGGVSVPWAMNASSRAALTIFVAYVAGGDCGTHRGLEVLETHETITITAVNDEPIDAAACLANPSIAGGSFDLEHVLGDRQLIHGGLSAPWTDADNPLPRQAPPVEPTPGPTVAPVLQDAVYLTSEGVGDIRIDEPIPTNSTLVSYDPTLCNDSGKEYSGGWMPKPPFDPKSAGHLVFDPVTSHGFVDDSVTAIWVRSPEIPTKSGIRVGDSLEELLTTYPDIGDPVQDEVTMYIIPGIAGKVIFAVGYPDYRGEWEGGTLTVLSIVVLPIDAPTPVWATDTNGTCKA